MALRVPKSWDHCEPPEARGVLVDIQAGLRIIALGIAMDSDCVSLALASSWWEEQLLLVQATDALRLCRGGSYQELPCEQAVSHAETLAERDMASVRAFVAQVRLSSSSLDMLDHHKVLALLTNSIRGRDLVALRRVEAALHQDSDSTSEQRKLVRKIETKCPRGLNHAGRRYRLVADADVAKLPDRDSYEVVRHSDAVAVVGAMARQPGGPNDLTSLLTEATGKLATDWRAPLSPDGLVLLRRLRVLAAAPIAADAPITPSQMKAALAAEATHKLDFVFEYLDGKPVSGLAYTLIDPDQQRIEGKLGNDGRIHKDDVEVGVWTVELKAVELVQWEKRRIRCNDEVKLYATTSGIAPGASARVRVFREHREAEDEALDEVQTTLAGTSLEYAWKYDWKKDDERRAEQGVISLVAEVALEDGKLWAKSAWPLQVELRTLVSVTWSRDQVADGEDAELEIRTLGIPDGEELRVELWSHDRIGEDRKLADLPPAKVEAGRARARIPYRQAPGDERPDERDGSIHRRGEYYIRVRTQGEARRDARSDVIWCGSPQLLQGVA